MDTNMEITKATLRNAIEFGFFLANKIAEDLENNRVPPSRWPTKTPISMKEIKQLPGVGNNVKIAKKIKESATIIWNDMRKQAMYIEKDMKLHPEMYISEEEMIQLQQEGNALHNNDYKWRHLSVLLEQISGALFLSEFFDEESAKNNVYSMISAKQLKTFMTEFDDDFYAFINEIREAIRNKNEISARERFDLICLLNTELQLAKTIKRKPRSAKQ